MAKVSSINKNEKRKKLVKKYAGRYSRLKAIANDVFKFIKIVNKVFFIETYEGAKPKEPEAAPALPTPQPAAEAITQEVVPTPAPQPIPEAPPQLTPEPSTEEAASA